MTNNPLYLVTGIAGFIGSHIGEALLRRGYRVRGIDNFSTGKRSHLQTLHGLDLVEGDINDRACMTHAMRDVTYVLHQAAVPSVPRSVADPMTSHIANATGTLSVLEAARQSGTVKRLVYASTSSAYGDTPVLPKVETMPTHPKSPYAVSKLAGEQYCVIYHTLYGLETVCLRYFNVFGPRQDPNSTYAAVIPKFIASAMHGEKLPVFGDGEQTRDFCYVDNVVDANLKACMASSLVAGQVLNIGCGEQITLRALIEKIGKAMQRPVTPTFLPARAGDVRDTLADISKAKALLGYTPAVLIDEGLRRLIAAAGS